jgi:hypothetical protein
VADRVAPPDVALLAVDWQSRALIRAQLIEEGFVVVAMDTWPVMRRQLGYASKPRLAIVDLKELPNPETVLADLRVLMKPSRVLVLTTSGTLSPETAERMGFRRLSRPFAIKDVVDAAAGAIKSSDDSTDQPA